MRGGKGEHKTSQTLELVLSFPLIIHWVTVLTAYCTVRTVSVSEEAKTKSRKHWEDNTVYPFARHWEIPMLKVEEL